MSEAFIFYKRLMILNNANNQMIVCNSRLKIVQIPNLQIQLLLQRRTHHLLLTHPSGLDRSGVGSRRSGTGRGRSGRGHARRASGSAVTVTNSVVAKGHVTLRNDGLERNGRSGRSGNIGRSAIDERIREGRIVGRSSHVLWQSAI